MKPGSQNLLARFGDEEREDIATTLVRFGPIFRAYFLRRGIPEIEAEEMALELIKDIILSKIDHYDRSKGPFEAWLHTLKAHAAVDYWRRQDKVSTRGTVMVPLSDAVLNMREYAPSIADPEDDGTVASAAGTKRGGGATLVHIVIARGVLQQLSQNDREILIESVKDDEENWRAVGSRLGITANAAKVRYFRAKERFSERFLAAIAVGEGVS